MSRYIDADALVNKLYSTKRELLTLDSDAARGIGLAIKAINDAPSIDIVRCKECKWHNICEIRLKYALLWCSDGERSDT